MSSSARSGQLKVFLNESVDTSSWQTILQGLQRNPGYAYVAFNRDDTGTLTALSYRWDNVAVDYSRKENWDRCLRELQNRKFYTLSKHPHTDRLQDVVQRVGKLWVDQHCIPQVGGKMGCVAASGKLYHGRVTTFLTRDDVDDAFSSGRAHEILGREENWLGRGWVQQEVTARGRLVNMDAYEYFYQQAKRSGDDRLTSGGESLCILLRRMKGESEPLADRIVRFYAVMEADFTIESDRQFNVPDFSDAGYQAFDIGRQPNGWRLQPEIRVQGNRVALRDSRGATVAKWFKRQALYCQG